MADDSSTPAVAPSNSDDAYGAFLKVVNDDTAPAADEPAMKSAEEGVAVAAEGETDPTAPTKDTAADAPAADGRFTRHPPSFFTDDRGNLKAVCFVVRHPCAIFAFLIGLCVVISFLLQVFVFRAAEGGNPFTVPRNEFDLQDVRSVQYDSFRLAKDEVASKRSALESAANAVPRQSELAAIAYWVFESERDDGDDGGGVFGTRESIQAMKDAYDIFLDDPNFEQYCALDYQAEVPANGTRKCVAPLSPLGMYYASEWDAAVADSVIDRLKDPDDVERFNRVALCAVENITLVCDLLKNVPIPSMDDDIAWARELGADIKGMAETWDMEGELVEDHEQATELAAHLMKTERFRGQVDFGYDKGFSAENPVSRYSRGIVFWGAPLRDLSQGTTKEDAEETEETDDDQRKEFIKANYLDKMNKQSEKGTHSEINSYYFMTALIGDVILEIVTQDALLAVFSFVFVVLWLRINTQSWFLALVGFFEIFFSIPIAWFIFSVVFQIQYFATLNSLALFIVAAIGADDIFIFMDAYKQSQYHPEILGDLETRMSWVYRRTGTAMAITSATTCAAFLCTLITPLASLQSFGIFAAVTILIDYVLVMTLFCTAVVIYHNRYENSACFGCCCPCGPVVPSNTEEARLALETAEGEIKRDRVSEFFKTKVAGFVMNPKARAGLCVAFCTWLGVAIWQMSLLEPTKESEQFLDEEHPLQKSISLLDKHFPTADDDLGLQVHFVWGVDQVDRTGVNLLLDPEDYGQPNFVSEFDFNAQCQTDLLAFCDKLRTDSDYKDLIKRKSGVGSVWCFLEELAAFNVKGDLKDCDYVRQGQWRGEDWQVDPSQLGDIMVPFLNTTSCLAPSGRDSISGYYQDQIGWDGESLRFASITAESKVLDPFGIDGESLTRGEYDQFIRIAEEQEQIISKSCSGSVIMTDLDGKFVFMNNQSIYVQSAIQSSILGVVIAFGVLLISTRVLHLAFFASLSILSVLVSVVGTMVMLGWNLGSIESTLIGIIAGFSVDYVVHLAHAYEIAKGDTYSRITEAFSDLGISVFNGMITSVAASIPLFFCQLQFFAKFGTFLCLTIAYSWIFANFGFMTLLAQLKIPVKDKGCRL